MFKDTKEGKTNYCKACEELARGMYVEDSLHTCGFPPIPMKQQYKKCEECLAFYTGEHECFGLMKHLVKMSKEKCTCGYEQGHGLTCPLYQKPENPVEL